MNTHSAPPMSSSRNLNDSQGTAGPEHDALGGAQASLVLPPADTKRWSSRRKAAVVIAIRSRVLTREQACQHYLLSEEELGLWEAAFDKIGIPGLRTSSLRYYRPMSGRNGCAMSPRR